MDSIEILVVVSHVIVAIAVIGLVLLQHGKGADAGAAFGGGASQTVFGSQGSSSFLSKMTAWLAVIFFLTSFGLAYLAKQRSVTVESNPLGLPAVVEDQSIDADVTSDDNLPEMRIEEPVEQSESAPAIDSDADMPTIDADMESTDEGSREN
ncbi:MAG: preprotein translocase subunit SecG [unclassified Hahellaceae]|nr:preprotein translocase subunit SecG [Hahellaceae bacterium]